MFSHILISLKSIGKLFITWYIKLFAIFYYLVNLNNFLSNKNLFPITSNSMKIPKPKPIKNEKTSFSIKR